MLYKALKSFGGKVSMRKGETKEINDNNLVKDLLKVGYIEQITTDAPISEQVDAEVSKEVKKPKNIRKKK